MMSKNNKKPSIAGLMVVAMSIVTTLTVLFLSTIAAQPASTAKADENVFDPHTWWSPPKILLPYVRDVNLAVNPVDKSVSYVTDSEGYGVVSGNENSDWLHQNFLKIGTDTPNLDQYPTAAYNEQGDLFTVWGARDPRSGNMHIMYNRIIHGNPNVGLPRDLTHEIFGQSADPYDSIPSVAYSIQQKKVFVVFEKRDVSEGGDSDTSPVYFIESADQGTTWSQPLQLGTQQGYSPPNPAIVVDQAGNPNVFIGAMSQSGGRSWLYQRVRVGGNWGAPVEVSGGNRTRLFRPKFTLGPDGTLWGVTVTDPESGVAALKEVEVIHQQQPNGTTWQHFNNVAQSSGANFATLAVGKDGAVWVIWTDITGDVADWRIKFTYSTDNAQSWRPAMQALRNSDFQLKRHFGIAAVASKDYIYLAITGENTDPNQTSGPTLFLQIIPQVSRPDPSYQPPSPSPTPTNTANSSTTAPGSTPTPTATMRTTTTTPPTTALATATAPTTAIGNGGGNNIPGNGGSSTTITTGTTNTFQVAPSTVVAATATAVPPTPTKAPTSTPVPPTPTLAPQMVQAQALATNQAVAARTPQRIVVPVMPTGIGGKGPAIVLPTTTNTALPSISATPTPEATSTTNVVAEPTTQQQTATAITPVFSIPTVTPSSATQPFPTKQQNNEPPSPGFFLLLPIGIAAIGKGILNAVVAAKIGKIK